MAANVPSALFLVCLASCLVCWSPSVLANKRPWISDGVLATRISKLKEDFSPILLVMYCKDKNQGEWRKDGVKKRVCSSLFLSMVSCLAVKLVLEN